MMPNDGEVGLKKSSFSFRVDEQVAVHVHAWIPASTPFRGVVVIVHGMAEYADRYDEFARFFAQNQYAVYASDQRGHGFSLNTSKVGFFSEREGWKLVLKDLHKLIQYFKQRHPNLPFILFGHSMGSLLARTYAIEFGRHIDRLVLTGTAHDPGLLSTIGLVVAKTLSFIAKPHTPSRLMTLMTFAGCNKTYSNRRTKFDFLSRDQMIVDRYVDDPLCGFECSNAFYVDMLTGLKFVHRDENVRRIPPSLPILLLSGGDDPVGDYGRGVKKVYRQMKANGCVDVALKIYPGARHELTNETNRCEVFEEILSWVEKH